MAISTFTLTPALARAARALTQVSAREIADFAALKKSSLRDYERGLNVFDDAEKAALVLALKNYGVVFIREDVVGGQGVRFRHGNQKVKQIERWEDEGGPVQNDDVD